MSAFSAMACIAKDTSLAFTASKRMSVALLSSSTSEKSTKALSTYLAVINFCLVSRESVLFGFVIPLYFLTGGVGEDVSEGVGDGDGDGDNDEPRFDGEIILMRSSQS